MAFQRINNVRIAGVASSVPFAIEENRNLDLFKDEDEYKRFVESTGVERRRKSPKNICASDLCHAAAEELISELGWDKQEIECLIFVSHSADYKFPATACILQDKLGLSSNCMSLDISLGCSGWVYGLSTLASL
ncbi:MAG: ketoacyl-ACP synthase III, partial [Balneolaceae bacterium]|nr:ketoacyl-ACP synthase III [Balneolaceae bacterium]